MSQHNVTRRPTGRRQRYNPSAHDTAYAALEAVWRAEGSGMPDSAYFTTSKLVADLVVNEAVFQPRGLLESERAIQRNVDDLCQLLKDDPALGEKGFDPLLIYPIDGRFVVVDGHCRLAAYKRFGLRSCRVKVFRGSFEEAVNAAIFANSGVKLSLNSRERYENTWRVAKRDSLLPPEEQSTARRIADTCQVGLRTVENMRAVLKRGLPAHPQVSLEDIRSWEWGKVRHIERVGPDGPHFEDAEKIRVIATALEKGTGRFLRADASLFWPAARKGYGEELARKLHSYAASSSLPVLLGDVPDPASDF